jgi:hypothetical protein
MFRGAGFFMVNNSGKSLVYAVLSYALPLSGILGFGLLVLFHKAPRIAQSWVDRAGALAERLQRVVSPFGFAWIGSGRDPGGRG